MVDDEHRPVGLISMKGLTSFNRIQVPQRRLNSIHEPHKGNSSRSDGNGKLISFRLMLEQGLEESSRSKNANRVEIRMVEVNDKWHLTKKTDK